MSSPSVEPRFRRFQLLLTFIGAATLLWTVAAWRGWIGGEKPFQPLRSIFLLSYFTLMSASWVARDRSPRLANTLGFGAMAAFVLFVVNLMAG